VLYVHPDRDVTPAVAASRRATLATRRLIAATVNSAAPTADLEAAADALEQLADALEPHARTSRYDGTPGVRLGGDNTAILESHPMMGPSNPLAPPISLTRDADGVRATAIYGHQYEGPPGRVHGGLIADAEGVMVTVPEDTFHGGEANDRGVGTLRRSEPGPKRPGAQRREREG